MKRFHHSRFDYRDFACKDGNNVPPRFTNNSVRLFKTLRRLLRAIRHTYPGARIYLTSAYRTKSYNKKVGGARRSKHLTCEAADIVVKTDKGFPISPSVVYDTADLLQEIGYLRRGGLHAYISLGFTHIDIRGRKARW